MSAKDKKINIIVPILKERETEAWYELVITVLISQSWNPVLDPLPTVSKSQHTQDKTGPPRSAGESLRTPVHKGSRCRWKFELGQDGDKQNFKFQNQTNGILGLQHMVTEPLLSSRHWKRWDNAPGQPEPCLGSWCLHIHHAKQHHLIWSNTLTFCGRKPGRVVYKVENIPAKAMGTVSQGAPGASQAHKDHYPVPGFRGAVAIVAMLVLDPSAPSAGPSHAPKTAIPDAYRLSPQSAIASSSGMQTLGR